MQENEKKRTNEELVALYQRTKDEAILAQLLQRNKGLMYIVAGAYETNPSKVEDLVQEGRITLWEAACRYKGDGAMFSTFFKACLQQKYNRLYNYEHTQKRGNGTTPDSLDRLIEIDRDGAIADRHFTINCNGYDLAEVKELVAKIEFTEKERIIVNLIIEGDSKADIAADMGVTKATISYYIRQINKKLLTAGYRG